MSYRVSNRSLFAVVVACLASASCGSTQNGYKGNTHTRWSDGNGAPELVVSYYTENDYEF